MYQSPNEKACGMPRGTYHMPKSPELFWFLKSWISLFGFELQYVYMRGSFRIQKSKDYYCGF